MNNHPFHSAGKLVAKLKNLNTASAATLCREAGGENCLNLLTTIMGFSNSSADLPSGGAYIFPDASVITYCLNGSTVCKAEAIGPGWAFALARRNNQRLLDMSRRAHGLPVTSSGCR
jgi:hypothetical protein